MIAAFSKRPIHVLAECVAFQNRPGRKINNYRVRFRVEPGRRGRRDDTKQTVKFRWIRTTHRFVWSVVRKISSGRRRSPSSSTCSSHTCPATAATASLSQDCFTDCLPFTDVGIINRTTRNAIGKKWQKNGFSLHLLCFIVQNQPAFLNKWIALKFSPYCQQESWRFKHVYIFFGGSSIFQFPFSLYCVFFVSFSEPVPTDLGTSMR